MIRLVALCISSVVLWSAPLDDARKKIKEGKYEEVIADLEATLKKNPKSPADVKLVLSDAYLAQGETTMFNKALPPFQKYPAALKSLRKALDYNPRNLKAKDHINTIEGIYKSMGRPVPQ
jgi:tetratricopeptide (TPR) repeat protein